MRRRLTRAGRRRLLGTACGTLTAAWLISGCTSAGDTDAAGTTPPASSSAFPSPSGAAPTVDPAAPFTQADADRISAALNSGDDATITDVLVPEFRAAFTAAGGDVLPAGVTVQLLTDRFTAVDPALGSVPLVVSGAQNANFLLLVSYVDGQWLVLGSEEVK